MTLSNTSTHSCLSWYAIKISRLITPNLPNVGPCAQFGHIVNWKQVVTVIKRKNLFMSILANLEQGEGQLIARITKAQETKQLVEEGWFFETDDLESESYASMLAFVLERTPQAIVDIIRQIAQDPRLEEYLSDDTDYEQTNSLVEALRAEYGIAFDVADIYIVLSRFHYTEDAKDPDERAFYAADNSGWESAHEPEDDID
jgi:hypothetical protein